MEVKSPKEVKNATDSYPSWFDKYSLKNFSYYWQQLI